MSDPIEILSKLFETLKDASNRNELATQKLIDQQMELVGHIKSMPLEEIRKALTLHVNDSAKGILDISNKITKIFIIVGVTLTVATSGYFLIRHTAERDAKISWMSEYKKLEDSQQKVIDEKLEKMMIEIRSEMRNLYEKDASDESVHK